MTAQLENFLRCFPDARKNGAGWTARCPAHNDTIPSLSILEATANGEPRILVYCHAGCSTESILQKVGRTFADLSLKKAGSRTVATYDYRDESGNLLYQVVRSDPKAFIQRQPDGNGGWAYNLAGVRRVLYRLPELIASTGDTILIVEGEKDTEAAVKLGFTATCNSGGAGKWLPEFGKFFAGKKAVVIADADEPGRKHAQQVAASLRKKAVSIKVLEPPGAKDLSDWVELFGENSASALRALIDKAPEHASAWRRAFKSIDEMEQGDLHFLIDQILPEGICMIGGLSGSFKTFSALSMVRALTAGGKFLGNFVVPEPVSVLYLIPESGERAFRRRLERMQISERFLCQTMKDGVLALDNPLLTAAVEELHPVVFLDTAVRFSEAESENSSTENAKGLAADIFALLRAGARAVVGVHHSPKASAGLSMTLENVLRGTGDLGAMCDAVYGLQVKNFEAGRVLVKCVKARDFEPVPEFQIQARPYIDETGDFVMLTDDALNLPSLSEAITAHPKATYRELSSLTGIRQANIRKQAAEFGWAQSGGIWQRSANSQAGIAFSEGAAN